MPAPIPVAILGFSTPDRQDLAASLQRTARRIPAYNTVLGVDDARFVVADADHAEVMALLQALGRTHDAVLIHGLADGGLIDPALVLHQLDSLQAHSPAPPIAAIKASAAKPAAAAQVVVAAAMPEAASAAAAAPLPAPRRPSPWRKAHDDARQRRQAAQVPKPMPRVLLVDDSEIALHFLRRQLERYGVETDLARHSDRALDLLSHHPYGLVFLDLDLGDDSRVDGLTLCHQIRHRLQHPGGRTPAVVMVSAFHDPVHQVRGTLAGADAYLGKPLDPAALEQVMRRLGLVGPSLVSGPLPVPVPR